MAIMTLKQAARDYFGGQVGYAKLLRLARTGKLPTVRIGGRYLTKTELLDAWFTAQAVGRGRLRVVKE